MSRRTGAFAAVALALGLPFACSDGRAASGAGERGEGGEGGLVLFDFDKDFDVAGVETRDVKLSVSGRRKALVLRTGHSTDWPGITLKAPKGRWDLSRYEHVSLDVRNVGANNVTAFCRVDNPGADGRKNCVTANVRVAPGEVGTLTVLFQRGARFSKPVGFIGMRGAPGAASGIDTTNVVQLLVFVARPREDHEFEISRVRAGGRARLQDADGFFPFIDEFGQYIHEDWPGKTRALAEFTVHAQKELSDIGEHPGPDDRDRFGGWRSGPRLEATGFFRVEKHSGKWWLVDPDGRLFWSHGIDCVGHWSGTTPLTDRRHYFRGLPEKGAPLAEFHGRGKWAPRGYYKGKGQYETYNFTAANLRRKYGDAWRGSFAEITHARLRSWGMNTIANWSDRDIYLRRQTPYVVTIHYSSPRIEGSTGLWSKFPDVFDPGFRKAVRRRLEQERDRCARDPRCVGFFVDNELHWGKDTSLSLASLTSPPGQAAKKAFVEELKAKHGTIGKLNAKWGTGHASWAALTNSRKAPDGRKAGADLRDFYTR
ncbi:MAG: beta-agarase, partial [Planctomycetota bacterium]